MESGIVPSLIACSYVLPLPNVKAATDDDAVIENEFFKYPLTTTAAPLIVMAAAMVIVWPD
jgi:hypothetical protein